MTEAFVIDTVRTPRAKAKKDGAYADCKPVDLLRPLFQALLHRNGIESQQVEDVLLGCSTQVGEQGANLAKIASLYAGWSHHVSGVTLNRFCCSGLDAVNLAASKLMAGMESLLVAGGVEQLTQVPMFSDKGAWFSNPQVMEATRFIHMGLAADLIACQQGYDKSHLDELSLKSHHRAASAWKNGYFDKSIVPVNGSDGEPLLVRDNAVRPNLKLEDLSALSASFESSVEEGQKVVGAVYPGVELKAIHSPGNSPALVDGASLVLMANREFCQKNGMKPRAKIVSFANASDEPVIMLSGHIRATQKLLRTSGLTPDQIDLWEINESFAASVLKYQSEFNISGDKLNVNGGAIALGHPLGATGGNLLGMVLDELERRDLKRGLIAICGGAGVGVATLVERQ